MRLDIGQVYRGTYKPLRLLNEGVLGALYAADNVATGARVALRILHPELAARPESAQKYEREAQAASRLGSKHVVDVLDIGVFADGTRFMVLEFLEGMTLAERLQLRGQLTPEQISPIVVQLLSGLSAAHKASIVHRDLKPENVFLLKEKSGLPDFVKILDFGVTHFNVMSAENGMSFARTGAVLGTPFYFSPEQARGARQIDPRTDVYAVGAMLYESVSGRVPYQAETFNELLFKIVLESPTPLEKLAPDLDPAFASIIKKAMMREPAARFQSALEFQRALAAYLMRGTGVPEVLQAPGAMEQVLNSNQTGRTLPMAFARSSPPPPPLPPPRASSDQAPTTIRMPPQQTPPPPPPSPPTTLRMGFPVSPGALPSKPVVAAAASQPGAEPNGERGAAEVSLFEEFEEPTIALPRRPTEPPPLPRGSNATVPIPPETRPPPLPASTVPLMRPAAGSPAAGLTSPIAVPTPLRPPPPPPVPPKPAIFSTIPILAPPPVMPPLGLPTPQPPYAGVATPIPPGLEIDEPPVSRSRRRTAMAAVVAGVLVVATVVVLRQTGAFGSSSSVDVPPEPQPTAAPTAAPSASPTDSVASAAQTGAPSNEPSAAPAPTAEASPPRPATPASPPREPDVDDRPKSTPSPRPVPKPPPPVAATPTSSPAPQPTGRTITPDL